MHNRVIKRPISKLGALSVAIASLTTTPIPALGQQLEEVLVTATRRAESLQEVPIAVSALSADALKKGGLFETSDLNRAAPNLQVSSPYGTQQPNFSIRGVGVGTEYNANAASPVGVYVDEVYQTFRASHGQQLYDLEQIEIVRGPQGTLFGRNTTGGAINFLTVKPSLEGTTGFFSLDVGDYDRVNVQGAVEFTPVADKFGVRIAGSYTEADSYEDNVLAAGAGTTVFGLPSPSGLNLNSGVQPGGSEDWGVRATFRFLPNDATDLTFKVYGSESEGGTVVPIPTGQDKNSDVIDYTSPTFLLGALFGGLNQAAPGVLPTSYSQSANGLGLRDIEADTAARALTETFGVMFRGEFAMNDSLSFIGVAGYDEGEYRQDPNTDCDATPLRLCSIGYNSEFEAYNIDLRLDYQVDRLKLIAGAFYAYDEIDTANKPDFFNILSDVHAALGQSPTYFNPAGGFNGVLLPADALPTGIRAEQNYTQDRDSWAIYAEGNYAVTDKVNLTVGLRYSEDQLEFKDGYTTYFDDAGNPRMLSVSNFFHTGAYQAYFLDDFFDAAGNLVAPAAALNGGAPFPDPRQEEGDSDSVSGRIIVDWQATEGAMLYASYSRGYRAGTMNGLAYGSGNQIYFVEPEEVDAFELGFKTRWIDDRLQLNGALFFYDYQGQQGQVVDNTATANLLSLDGEITGFEIDMQLAVTDTFFVNAAYGWLDSEYDSNPCDPANPPTGFPAQDGNCIVSSGGAVDVGGNAFPYAAESTFNIGFDWDIAEFGGGVVQLHGDGAYTGQYYYDAFEEYQAGPLPNVARGKFTEGEGDYWVFNARLSYVADNYTVALWGKNLGDEEYYPFGISIENLFGNGYRILAPPRTYGVELKYTF